jgi:DNA-binding protein WhiA
MSFSYETKNELCRLPVQKLCCARAEAYGILLYCNTFNSAEVRVITENTVFAARLPRLFHRAFNLQFDRQPEPEQPGKLVFQITERSKLDRIINLLGYAPEQNLALHLNFGMVEEECCRASFLRGVFFAGGSITDPLKRYHLELTTSHLQASRELESLLRECGFDPKNITRNGSCITYFKQSEHIEDFLTMIGAPVAAMNVMSAKMEKDLRNSVNRRLNCDSANLDKAVEASQEQLEAIRALMAAKLMDQLPDKLQLTASLRLENPELTLSELAEEFDPPITKSCLNHRLRKLLELAAGLAYDEKTKRETTL